VDGRTISLAELWMAPVEEFGLAEIVGEPTAGTNGNVNPFPIPGDFTVRWTSLRVRRHDGSPHHGVGIQPTIPVTRTLAGVVAGRDEFLEAAIEAVTSP
jgi:C-terminal processing protease CtpA/Prc